MNNERIRELLKKATRQVNPEDREWVFSKVDQAKFAELIVQECVKHITDQQDLVETNWQCKDGIHIVYNLKEHFGIKES